MTKSGSCCKNRQASKTQVIAFYRDSIYNQHYDNHIVKDIASTVKIEHTTPSSFPPKPVGSLKKPSARWLKQQGVDPHTVKEALPGPVAHFDIFKDKVNNLFAKRKGLPDMMAEWLGHLDDFKEDEEY